METKGKTIKAGRYGKAAPQFPEALKPFKAYLTAELPAPPATVDDYSKVGNGNWPMDGNDHYGDCTIAAAAHALQCWNAVTAMQDQVPSEKAVVAQYLALTHGADNGLVESKVLKTWRTQGLWNNKIVA